MRNDLTDITLVVDRSGSMASCQKEAQGGINAFIEDQKKKVGDALFSLLQFDTEHEYVFNAKSIKDVGNYELVPRGMTALLDAVGKAINETGVRLASMKEEDRPGLVVFAIVTDGEENSSHEFSKATIKQMIERQTKDYNWQFTYLGANQDAFAEAGSMGISKNATANYSVHNSGAAYGSLSQNVANMRVSCFAGNSITNAYDDEQRKQMSK